MLSSENGRRPALHKKAGGLLAVRRYAEAVREAGRLPNAAHAAADTVRVHLRHSAVRKRKVLILIYWLLLSLTLFYTPHG
jgi:hypothetical protein